MDIFDRLQNRSSVRSFDTTKSISLEHEQKIIGAAQRASTSFNLQTYCFISIKNSENRKKLAELSGEQWFICKASLFYVVCVDLHKMDFVANKSGYKYYQKDLVEGFLMACIDTAIAGQTAALAAESLGYGICMIGGIRNHVDKVCDVLQLPQLVVPLFGLCVGHPRKVNPPKPRLPLSGILLEDTYDKSSVEKAIEEYDQQMAESGMYENREFPKSDIEELHEVAKDKYGWIEHCARRISTQDPLKSRADLLRILRERGFPLG